MILNKFNFIIGIIFFYLFIIIFSLLLTNSSYISFIIKNSSNKNFLLLNYQLNKIESSNFKTYKTIFFGDSSLGNAINNEFFSKLSGKKTINLALTESYGYSSIYNLIKKSLKKNSSIEDIIIINSFFFENNSDENTGYYITSDTMTDFFASKNKINFILKPFIFFPEYMKLIFNKKNNENIFKNDYVIQNDVQNLVKNKKHDLKNLNDSNLYYLNKIISICETNKLNLILIKGPVYESFYTEDMENYKKQIRRYERFDFFINTLNLLSFDELGDYPMHVNYQYKNKITLNYYNILKDYLL